MTRPRQSYRPQAQSIFAQRVATASFCLDAFFQTIALLGDAEISRSSPSSLYVAFSPHPYGPLLLLAMSVITQLLWVMKLFPLGPGARNPPVDVVFCLEQEQSRQSTESEDTVRPKGSVDLQARDAEIEMKEEDENQEADVGGTYLRDTEDDHEDEETETILPEPIQMRYLPYYMLGSICQAAWSMTWMTRHYEFCTPLLLIDFFAEIYAFFGLLGGARNARFPTSNVLTHFVVKVRIALCVLSFCKTWGAVDIIPPPTTTEGTIACLFLTSLSVAFGPDPSLGLLLSLVLFSLAMGRHNNIGWQLAFNWSTVIVFLTAIADWALGAGIRKMIWGRSLNAQAVEGRKVDGLSEEIEEIEL